MTRVKICGITRLEDAEVAAELGAWAIGLILWPGSPRAADPAVAAAIAARVRRRVEVVGVFVDPTLDEVARTADTVGLTHLQIHGSVGPSFCAEAGRRTGCKVIRAFRVGSGADVQEADRFRIGIDFHLFDTRREGLHGGTGESWDWSLAGRRRSRAPLILSGGLTPENVGEGIEAVRPYAVDVASGTDAEPGVKDHEKVRDFIAAANAAAGDPEPAPAAP